MLKVIAVLLSVFSVVFAKIVVSDIIKICSLKDPNLNDCIKQKAQEFLPFISKGIPEYGFPSLNPLQHQIVIIDQKDHEVANLYLEMRDSEEIGLHKMQFYAASMDIPTKTITLNTSVPVYDVQGDYTANGKLLDVDVIGKGFANMTFLNGGIDMILTFNPATRDGKEYIDLGFKVFFTFGNAVLHFTDLHNGNLDITESTNQFLNDHANEVAKEVEVTVEKVYSKQFGDIAQKFFDHVAFSDIFADA